MTNVRPLQLAILRLFDSALECIGSALPEDKIPIGDWSVQGFGMMRLYIRKVGRLHIWDSALRYPGVSMVHNHSWDLRSTVISGVLLNRRWEDADLNLSRGEPWKRRRIVTGYNCHFVEEISDVNLYERPHQYFFPGSVYSQAAAEIHMTDAEDGSITLMERNDNENGEADLFWRVGEEWGTAKPRPVTKEEVFDTIQRALPMLLGLIEGRQLVDVTTHDDAKRRYVLGACDSTRRKE